MRIKIGGVMAKRFCETAIWDDVWFQELPISWKCLWWYLFSKCDAAGIWKVNKKLAEFQLGEKIKWDKSQEFLNKDKVRIDFYEDVWVIKSFVLFQYGEKVFTSDHSFHKQLREKINTLSDRVSHRVYENEDVKREIVKREKKFCKIPPAQEDVITYFSENSENTGKEAERFFNYYTSNGWKVGKNKMIDWKAAVRNWIKNQKIYQNTGGKNETNRNSIKRDGEKSEYEGIERNI